MKLYAKLEDPNAGYDSDSELAKTLDKDVYYEVEYIDMGSSYTSVKLVGIDGTFNSVNLEFYKRQGEKSGYTEHDIFSDPNYNPYL